MTPSRTFLIVLLCVTQLSVVMLSVVILNVIKSVIRLNTFTLWDYKVSASMIRDFTECYAQYGYAKCCCKSALSNFITFRQMLFLSRCDISLSIQFNNNGFYNPDPPCKRTIRYPRLWCQNFLSWFYFGTTPPTLFLDPDSWSGSKRFMYYLSLCFMINKVSQKSDLDLSLRLVIITSFVAITL